MGNDLIYKLMTSFHAKLDTSLSLRKKIQSMKKKDKDYEQTFNKLVLTERECQELDEKIRNYTIELYLEKEYFANPKTTK